jgi:hypothetical protein
MGETEGGGDGGAGNKLRNMREMEERGKVRGELKRRGRWRKEIMI